MKSSLFLQYIAERFGDFWKKKKDHKTSIIAGKRKKWYNILGIFRNRILYNRCDFRRMWTDIIRRNYMAQTENFRESYTFLDVLLNYLNEAFQEYHDFM